ncbi:hypothetical protein [Streptosporangium jomthongense]|uniref:Uncharacterized protein n=1 Tax=Streptosporangium jomthongense TaxID=1193683 RepID=A0ABV8FEW6_9ACTN
MTKTDSKPEIFAAVPELVALAVAVRRDWRAEEVQAALVNAKSHNQTWPQALVGLVRLAVDPESHPAELVPPPLDPQRPGPRVVGDPQRHADALAAAKQACADGAAALRAAGRTEAES